MKRHYNSNPAPFVITWGRRNSFWLHQVPKEEVAAMGRRTWVGQLWSWDFQIHLAKICSGLRPTFSLTRRCAFRLIGLLQGTIYLSYEMRFAIIKRKSNQTVMVAPKLTVRCKQNMMSCLFKCASSPFTLWGRACWRCFLKLLVCPGLKFLLSVCCLGCESSSCSSSSLRHHHCPQSSDFFSFLLWITLMGHLSIPSKMRLPVNAFYLMGCRIMEVILFIAHFLQQN